MLVLLGTCWIPGGQSAWLLKGCLLGCLYPGGWAGQETDKWNTSCCRVSAVSEFMVFLPLSIKFAVSQKQNIDLIYVLSLYALTPTLAPLALRISSLVPASLQLAAAEKRSARQGVLY